jgi:hypothetical protein
MKNVDSLEIKNVDFLEIKMKNKKIKKKIKKLCII